MMNGFKLFYSFGAGLLLSLGVWLLLLKSTSSNLGMHYAALYNLWNKKVEILKNTESPKIVLLGGSNVSFSTQATLIEEELKMPTVNAGLNAATSFDFLTWLAKPYLNSGDILLMPLEYNFYRDNYTFIANTDKHFATGPYDDYLKSKTLRHYLRIILSISYMEMIERIVNGQNIHRKTVNFTRELSSRGDVINNLSSLQNQKQKQDITKTLLKEFTGQVKIDEKSATWGQIKHFVEWCRNNNVTVVFAWPSLCNRSAYTSYESFAKLPKLIEQFMDKSKITLLGNHTDNLYPEHMFFDTMYHMNSDGAKIRTKYIIKELKKELSAIL
jgi:hypothetical protein